MGLIRFNSRRVIHMFLDYSLNPVNEDRIFIPMGFRVTETTSNNIAPMKNYICVLTCSYQCDEEKMELLTLEVDSSCPDIQRKVEFTTPSDIQVSLRLMVPKGGNPKNSRLLLPKIYQQYIMRNFQFNFYVMETFPDDKLSQRELYNGMYLGEAISVVYT